MTTVPNPLRIGILGAARIARLFTAAVRTSGKVRITAIAAREEARGRAFASELGIARVHGSYEALLADPEIDAVYVPLPNNLHAAWSIRAAQADKHVLCEKPLAANAAEARAIFDAMRANDVYVAEGYPYRTQPQTIRLRELLAQDAIGRVQYVHAAFGFPLADAANIRMNPALAGGALMDAGSYPVSFVRMACGVAPRRAHAIARWAETGVDSALIGALDFDDGRFAQISCSFATARHRKALIVGETGSIETTFYNDTSPQMPPTLVLRRGIGWDAKQETIETETAAGFCAEAEAFADLVAHGWKQWSGATPEESVDIARTLDALAASAREGRTVDLA